MSGSSTLALVGSVALAVALVLMSLPAGAPPRAPAGPAARPAAAPWLAVHVYRDGEGGLRCVVHVAP